MPRFGNSTNFIRFLRKLSRNFYNICPLFEPFARAFCLIHFHLIDTTEVERISQFLALLKHNNRTKQNVKIRLIHLY